MVADPRSETRPAWALAAAALAVAATWPLTDSLALHVLQHIALITVVPLVLLRGVPLLVPSGPALSVERGLVLVVTGILLVYAAHVPTVFEADLASTAARLGLHGLLLAAGLLMTVPVSGRRCVIGLGGVALVAVAELGVGALGMWLAWIPELVYRLPEGEEPRFGLEPGTDQSLAGAFILVLAEPLLAWELVVLLFRALDDDGDDDDDPESPAPDLRRPGAPAPASIEGSQAGS